MRSIQKILIQLDPERLEEQNERRASKRKVSFLVSLGVMFMRNESLMNRSNIGCTDLDVENRSKMLSVKRGDHALILRENFDIPLKRCWIHRVERTRNFFCLFRNAVAGEVEAVIVD